MLGDEETKKGTRELRDGVIIYWIACSVQSYAEYPRHRTPFYTEICVILSERPEEEKERKKKAY